MSGRPTLTVGAAPPDPAFEEARGPFLTVATIAACGDLDQLAGWFVELERKAVHIKAFIDAFNDADIDDEDWFRRAAGALAFANIHRRHVERRILLLGATPPYPPTDPRAREMRSLREKVQRLEAALAAKGGAA